MNDSSRLEELQKIEEKYKKRNKYINEWQKNNYYRLTVLIQKDKKQEIEKRSLQKGFKNVSDYIKALIDNDLTRDQERQPEKSPNI